MTIKEMIEGYQSQGLTIAQARSLVAQRIILSTIEKSIFVDKVLLKGGVVMYNMTQEKRRSTIDLDFDFVKYNIGDSKNIERFIETLNKLNIDYYITIDGPIQELNQHDYHGKRVKVLIKDETYAIKFKIDIGVHTLLTINQNKMCFSFNNDKQLFLRVNPPEQIFSEKLFSLAKIGSTSQRYRDVDNLYYLIMNQSLKGEIVKECLRLLTINQPSGIKDIDDVIAKADDCLNDSFFIENYKSNNGSWLNLEYNVAKSAILDFIYNL